MELPQSNPYKKDVLNYVIPRDNEKWGGLVKYDNYSRWSINDNDLDDSVNWIPMGRSSRQIPGNGTTIATLTSTVIWMTALPLNLTTYIFALCQNGHIYQVATGGTITDVGAGFATGANNCDITSWQGTNIIISDFIAQKIYNWNGATLATVFTVQPTNFVQVFSGRLWMAKGNVITFTNAGTFNSLGGDSGSFTIGDYDTPPSIIAMVPFLGQLYVFGPSWIQTIGNLYDSGTPAQLQFQRYTLEDQIGPINKWSIVPYGQILYFANASGFWKLVGLDPQQISGPVDGFFQGFSAAASSFSAAFAYIYSIPCVMWHANWTGSSYNGEIYIYTNDGQWCRNTASAGYTFITNTVVVATGLQTAFATTGTAIFQLFSSTSASVTSVAASKLLNFGHPLAIKRGEYAGASLIFTGNATVTLAAQDEQGNTKFTTTQSIGGTLTWVNNAGATVTWQNNTPAAVTWSGASTSFNVIQFAIPFMFKALGLQLTVVGSGTTLMHFMCAIKTTPALWGTP